MKDKCDSYEKLIVYAVEHLLDADLTEEDGWKLEEIKMLQRIENGKFKIVFED